MKYALLFILALVVNQNYSQCLNGNYDIGGLTPDYNSFQDAFDALEANGVCGPTLFYVHGGTYNEQAVLESFSNSSFLPVLFINTNLDSTITKISNNASTSPTDNFTLKLNDVDGVTFSHLGFRRVNPNDDDYSSVVYLEGTCQNIRFNNCYFETIENYYNHDLVYNEINTAQNNIHFENCYFESGGVAINFQVDLITNLQEENNSIKKCIFNNQSQSSIKLFSQNYAVIEDNFIYNTTYFLENNKSDSIYSAMHFKRPKSLNVSRNYISYLADTTFVPSHFSSVYRKNSKGISVGRYADSNFVSNNIIISANSNLSYPVYFDKPGFWPSGSINNLFFINNSIYSGSHTIIDFATYKPSVFANNIIKTDTSKVFNFNCFYNAFNLVSNDFVHENNRYEVSNDFGNYLSMMFYAGAETGSKIVQIPFADSLSDLHLLYDNEIRDQGSADYKVNVDYDSTVRDSFEDIGAMELGTVPFVDYGIAWINSHHFFKGVCTGYDTLRVALKNYGTTPLTDCEIHYRIADSIYAPIIYNGNLNSYESDTLAIEVYIPDQWIGLVKVEVKNASGISDFSTYNNFKQVNFYTRLHGDYDIGPGLDFESSLLATDRIKEKGICGNVTLNLYDSLYNYGVFDSIHGMTSSDTLSFVGKTGNIWMGGKRPIDSLSSGDFYLYRCEMETIGNLLFKNLNFNFGLVAECNSLEIDSCNFYENLPNQQNVGSLYYAGIHGGNSITVTNSYLEEGVILSRTDSIHENFILTNNLIVNSSIEFGDDSLSKFNNVVIENNEIQGVITGFCDSLNINNNYYENRLLIGAEGLNVDVFEKSFISQNNMLVNYFILTGDVNFVDNIVELNPKAYNFYAISKYDNTGIIRNNSFKQIDNSLVNFSTSHFISSTFQNNTTDSMMVSNNNFDLVFTYGFRGSSNTFFYNNIISVDSVRIGYELFYYNSNNQNQVMRNNVIHYDSAETDFYSGIHSMQDAIDLGYPIYDNQLYDAAVYADGIHVPAQPELLGQGVYLPGVPLVDYDGDPRSPSRIDIGADQIVISSQNDIYVSSVLTQDLCLGDTLMGYVYNNSADSLFTFNTNFSFNSSIQTLNPISNFVAPYDSILVPFGVVDYTTNGNYDIVTWVDYPNGNLDSIQINDTLVFNNDLFLPLSLGEDTVICPGSSVQLSVPTYNNSFTWSNGMTNDTILVDTHSSLSSMFEDLNGCISSDTIEIIQFDLSYPDVYKCENIDSLIVVSSDFQNVLWNTNISSQSFTLENDGQYTVYANDTAACSHYDTIMVSSPSLSNQIFSFEDSIICQNNFIFSLSSGDYYNPVWSDGSNSYQTYLSISKYETDTISITVTDSLTGCLRYDSVTFTTRSADVVRTDSICAYTVLAAPAFDTYLWLPSNEITESISVSNAGSYELSALDNDGCNYYDSIVLLADINVPPHIQNVSSSVLTNIYQREYHVQFENADSLFFFYGNGAFNTYDVDLNMTDFYYTHTYNTGIYDFYCVAINDCGHDTSELHQVNINPTGLSIQEIQSDIKMYPNPNNTSTLSFTNLPNIAEVSILNDLGQLVIAPKVLLGNNLDISGLPEGLYFVEIYLENNSVIRKKLIVIQ